MFSDDLSIGKSTFSAGHTLLDDSDGFRIHAQLAEYLIEVRGDTPLYVAGQQLKPDHTQGMYIVPRVGC